MNFDGIRLFLLGAKHQNVTRAAQHLRISQSAASRQLKQLEDELGTKLFTRTARGSELTEAGISFLTQVAPLWAQFEGLQKNYSPSRDSVTIGASHRPSKYLLPPLMAEFMSGHPAVKLALRTRSSVEIAQLLRDSKIDLAITTDLAMPASSFVSEPYGGEPLAAFVASSHPLARLKSLRGTVIGPIPVIIKLRREGQSRVEAKLNRFEKEGLKFKIVMRCESPEAVKEFVRQGAGVGFLYSNSIKRGIERGDFKTIKIPGLDITGQNYLVYSKDRPISPLAREFLSFLRTSFQNTKGADSFSVRISNKRDNGKPSARMLPPRL